MSEIGCSAWTSVKQGPEGEESSLNAILYPAKNSEVGGYHGSFHVFDNSMTIFLAQMSK